MVDREVDRPLWVVLGRSGVPVCGPGPLLGPMLAVWGRPWACVGYLELVLVLYGRSWAALRASIGGLGCTWAALGAYVGDLGPFLGLYWRPWVALGAALCSSGPLLEPMLAVLGRS